MNILLPFDLETTGLYKKSLPLNDPAQPHIVACSALQVRAEDLFVQQSMSKLVIPDGWEWDDSPESEDRAFQVHKLPVEYCKNNGRAEIEVLIELLDLWETGTVLVAHNLEFDCSVIACAIARYVSDQSNSVKDNAQAVIKEWLASPGFCTMKESKHIIKAQTRPNAKGVTRLKNPSLAEAYSFFTGEDIADHHSANRDAVACLQIWAGLREWNKEHG